MDSFLPNRTARFSALLEKKSYNPVVALGLCGIKCGAAVCVRRVEVDTQLRRQSDRFKRQSLALPSVGLNPRCSTTHSQGRHYCRRRLSLVLEALTRHRIRMLHKEW